MIHAAWRTDIAILIIFVVLIAIKIPRSFMLAWATVLFYIVSFVNKPWSKDGAYILILGDEIAHIC